MLILCLFAALNNTKQKKNTKKKKHKKQQRQFNITPYGENFY